MKSEELKRAVSRNTYEVAHALLERSLLAGLESYSDTKGIYVTGENFVTIIDRAVFNDMISHTIKVLDANPQSATFFAILRDHPAEIQGLKAYSKEEIDFLHMLASKLKIVRDKTHFHIDSKGVLDAKAVWKQAGITGKELGRGLNSLWEIMQELHKKICGTDFPNVVARYDGADIPVLLECARSKGLITNH